VLRDSEEANDGDEKQKNSTREVSGDRRQNGYVCDSLRVHGNRYQRQSHYLHNVK